MNNRTGTIILAIVAVALAVALFVVKRSANEQKERDTDTIVTLSNKWVVTSGDLEEQRQVNVMLTNDLATQAATFSNKLAETSSALAKSQDSLKTATDDLARRDERISELESQNQELDKRAMDLSGTITNLTLQIADTRRKLDSAEGDKAFLEKELQRLVAQKAELEKQFNDLDTVRAQVRKLKEDLTTARRLDWIRRGIMVDRKGAELTMQQNTEGRTVKTNTGPQYNLNVEVDSDGSIRVIPAVPLTNSPGATNQ